MKKILAVMMLASATTAMAQTQKDPILMTIQGQQVPRSEFEYSFNKNNAEGVIGNISIGGAVERAVNFSDRVSLLSENGAKTVLVPMDNLQEMATLPATILGKTDVPFYSNAQMLIQKMI